MSATPLLRTVEFNPEMLKWIELYCYDQETSFSEAMNLILTLGQQCIENNEVSESMPKPQKLLIQCAMESLLILQEALSPEKRKNINEQAKSIIRKTLNLDRTQECLPS